MCNSSIKDWIYNLCHRHTPLLQLSLNSHSKQGNNNLLKPLIFEFSLVFDIIHTKSKTYEPLKKSIYPEKRKFQQLILMKFLPECFVKTRSDKSLISPAEAPITSMFTSPVSPLGSSLISTWRKSSATSVRKKSHLEREKKLNVGWLVILKCASAAIQDPTLCLKLPSIYYKNLTWVWGADRKFRPEGHCLASQGFAKHAKQWSRGTEFFICTEHSCLILFSCIPFNFECFILKVSFITTHNDVDVGHF